MARIDLNSPPAMNTNINYAPSAPPMEAILSPLQKNAFIKRAKELVTDFFPQESEAETTHKSSPSFFSQFTKAITKIKYVDNSSRINIGNSVNIHEGKEKDNGGMSTAGKIFTVIIIVIGLAGQAFKLGKWSTQLSQAEKSSEELKPLNELVAADCLIKINDAVIKTTKLKRTCALVSMVFTAALLGALALESVPLAWAAAFGLGAVVVTWFVHAGSGENDITKNHTDTFNSFLAQMPEDITRQIFANAAQRESNKHAAAPIRAALAF